jgi:hypothetical protein
MDDKLKGKYPISLETLTVVLKKALSKVESPLMHFEIVFEDNALVFRRIEPDSGDGSPGMYQESIQSTVEIFGADERLAIWAEAFAQLQASKPVELFSTLFVLLSDTTFQTVDDFAAAMTDYDLITALDQAADKSWWENCETEWQRAWQAATIGNFVVLGHMLEKNPILATANDEFGFTLLHQVVERCDSFAPKPYIRCIDLLLTHGSNVNTANEDGNRPLHIARKEAIQSLLSRGAEIDARNSSGSTALLSWATEQDGLEPMSVLLEAGADVDARDASGKTSMDYARQRNEVEKISLLTQYESR